MLGFVVVALFVVVVVVVVVVVDSTFGARQIGAHGAHVLEWRAMRAKSGAQSSGRGTIHRPCYYIIITIIIIIVIVIVNVIVVMVTC